jgi:hypothetical protein
MPFRSGKAGEIGFRRLRARRGRDALQFSLRSPQRDPEIDTAAIKAAGGDRVPGRAAVACNLAGRLAWISDSVDGSRHDSHCMDESGVLIAMDPGNWAQEASDKPSDITIRQ